MRLIRLFSAVGLPFLLGLGHIAAPSFASAHADGVLALEGVGEPKGSRLPIVINTWFPSAAEQAWVTINDPESKQPALDAVEQGCAACEREQCDGTVGYGGSPDEAGETTLDAMVMDGTSMEVGAVSSLRHIKHAVATARLVLRHTRHSTLAGLQATVFAQEMGLPVEDLTTPESSAIHKQWVKARCQPNFRRNVDPDPTESCGPYRPTDPLLPSAQQQGGTAAGSGGQQRPTRRGGGGDAAGGGSLGTHAGPLQLGAGGWPSEHSHDTIAMAAIDADGNIAAACSTNGASHKVPGRVGDGSIPGGGAYADSEVGACGATGDGDIHLRFLPCYQVVESMRQGMKPKAAAEDAIRRIARRVPGYVGAVFALDKDGNHAGACFGWQFKYAYRDAKSEGVQLVVVEPLVLAPEELGGSSGGGRGGGGSAGA